jgi:hypothetical protein
MRELAEGELEEAMRANASPQHDNHTWAIGYELIAESC